MVFLTPLRKKWGHRELTGVPQTEPINGHVERAHRCPKYGPSFLSLSLPSPALTPSMSRSAWALQTAPCHCQPQEEPGAGQEAELQSSLPCGHYRGRQEGKGLVLPPRTLHPASPEMVQVPQ